MVPAFFNGTRWAVHDAYPGAGTQLGGAAPAIPRQHESEPGSTNRSERMTRLPRPRMSISATLRDERRATDHCRRLTSTLAKPSSSGRSLEPAMQPRHETCSWRGERSVMSHKADPVSLGSAREGPSRCDRTRRCRPGDARPKVESVLIGKTWGNPIVCNDGVTIAKEFDLKPRPPEETRTSRRVPSVAAFLPRRTLAFRGRPL